MLTKILFPAAKALTEEERTTCPDGHGGGVLPGAKRGGHPGGHLQSAGGNNPHGKGSFFRKIRQRGLDSEKVFAV
jgi:hypothetical protein